MAAMEQCVVCLSLRRCAHVVQHPGNGKRGSQSCGPYPICMTCCGELVSKVGGETLNRHGQFTCPVCRACLGSQRRALLEGADALKWPVEEDSPQGDQSPVCPNPALEMMKRQDREALRQFFCTSNALSSSFANSEKFDSEDDPKPIDQIADHLEAKGCMLQASTAPIAEPPEITTCDEAKVSVASVSDLAPSLGLAQAASSASIPDPIIYGGSGASSKLATEIQGEKCSATEEEQSGMPWLKTKKSSDSRQHDIALKATSRQKFDMLQQPSKAIEQYQKSGVETPSSQSSASLSSEDSLWNLYCTHARQPTKSTISTRKPKNSSSTNIVPLVAKEDQHSVPDAIEDTAGVAGKESALETVADQNIDAETLPIEGLFLENTEKCASENSTLKVSDTHEEDDVHSVNQLNGLKHLPVKTAANKAQCLTTEMQKELSSAEACFSAEASNTQTEGQDLTSQRKDKRNLTAEVARMKSASSSAQTLPAVIAIAGSAASQAVSVGTSPCRDIPLIARIAQRRNKVDAYRKLQPTPHLHSETVASSLGIELQASLQDCGQEVEAPSDDAAVLLSSSAASTNPPAQLQHEKDTDDSMAPIGDGTMQSRAKLTIEDTVSTPAMNENIITTHSSQNEWCTSDSGTEQIGTILEEASALNMAVDGSRTLKVCLDAQMAETKAVGCNNAVGAVLLNSSLGLSTSEVGTGHPQALADEQPASNAEVHCAGTPRVSLGLETIKSKDAQEYASSSNLSLGTQVTATEVNTPSTTVSEPTGDSQDACDTSAADTQDSLCVPQKVEEELEHGADETKLADTTSTLPRRREQSSTKSALRNRNELAQQKQEQVNKIDWKTQLTDACATSSKIEVQAVLNTKSLLKNKGRMLEQTTPSIQQSEIATRLCATLVSKQSNTRRGQGRLHKKASTPSDGNNEEGKVISTSSALALSSEGQKGAPQAAAPHSKSSTAQSSKHKNMQIREAPSASRKRRMEFIDEETSKDDDNWLMALSIKPRRWEETCHSPQEAASNAPKAAEVIDGGIYTGGVWQPVAVKEEPFSPQFRNDTACSAKEVEGAGVAHQNMRLEGGAAKEGARSTQLSNAGCISFDHHEESANDFVCGDAKVAQSSGNRRALLQAELQNHSGQQCLAEEGEGSQSRGSIFNEAKEAEYPVSIQDSQDVEPAASQRSVLEDTPTPAKGRRTKRSIAKDIDSSLQLKSATSGVNAESCSPELEVECGNKAGSTSCSALVEVQSDTTASTRARGKRAAVSERPRNLLKRLKGGFTVTTRSPVRRNRSSSPASLGTRVSDDGVPESTAPASDDSGFAWSPSHVKEPWRCHPALSSRTYEGPRTKRLKKALGWNR